MKRNNVNVLTDSIAKLVLKICLPMIFVSVVTVFTTTWMNDIYRAYCKEVFTVLGLLSTALSVLSFVTQGIVTAAWAQTATTYVQTPEKSNRSVCNAVYAGVFVQAVSVGGFLLFSNGILRLLNVPDALFAQAKTYYSAYVCSMLFYVIGQTFLQLVVGLGSSLQIFTVNLLNGVMPLGVGLLFLGVLKTGLFGAGICTGVSCVLIAMIAIVFLKKGNVIKRFALRDFKMDFPLIGKMIKRGMFLIAQTMLCNVGYLLVTYQTNKYLAIDYITVLSVSLPITSVFSAFSQLCIAVIPSNYALGTIKRTRAIFRVVAGLCAGYGLLVFLAFATLGNWYYGRLFDDVQLVRLGAEYWVWQGFGLFGCSFLFSFRFFLVAVSRDVLAMCAGVFELLGNLLAAFWLIPTYGNTGRSISYALGWWLAAGYLVIVYFLMRKRIYQDCGKMAEKQE